MKVSINEEPLYLYEFAAHNIMSYCDFINSSTTPGLSTNLIKVNSKGSTMFRDRFVHDIQFEDEDDFYTIYAKVKAEMKKRVIYSVSAKIMKNNEIVTTKCGCPGGVEPAACKHSFALLYAIESYSQKELYVTPTDVLQRWHQVKPKKHSLQKFGFPPIGPVTGCNFAALEGLPMDTPIFDVISATQNM